MKRQGLCAAVATWGMGLVAWGQCEEAWSEAFVPAFMRGGREASAAIFDEVSGPALVVSALERRGDEQTGLQMWDGAAWSTLPLPVGALGDTHIVRAIDGGRTLVMTDEDSGRLLDVFAREDGQWASLAFPAVDDFSLATCIEPAPDGGLYLGGLVYRGSGDYTLVYHWDGIAWTPLDAGSRGASAGDLAWFDDGSGSALFVSVLDEINDVPVAGVAKWDGQSWTEVGGGCPAHWPSLEVHDDGSGPALWALSDDGLTLAKWDGAAWASFALAPGDGFAWAWRLTSLELDGARELVWATLGARSALWRWDGVSGEQLGGALGGTLEDIVGDETGVLGPGVIGVGSFLSAGGAPACKVAAFDGGDWSALGTEDTGKGAPEARDLLAVGPEGGSAIGNRVYVSTISAGGVPVGGVAAWDGGSWEEVGSLDAGFASPRTLVLGDMGAGPRVFAAGTLTPDGASGRAIVAWDGLSWEVFRDGIGGEVLALAPGELNGVPTMYVGGRFGTVDGETVNNVAAAQSGGWTPLGDGLPQSGSSSVWVEAIALHDDGSGEAVYAGGAFRGLDAALANGVVRWDGSSWTRVGDPLDGFGATVFALHSADLGGGSLLYAGGNFDGLDDDLHNVAAWDGQAWVPLGEGTPYLVTDLETIETVAGLRLAATMAVPGDGQVYETVRLWDGETWEPFGAEADGTVRGIAQAGHEEGAVYIIGGFTEVAGVPSEGIARWGCLDECAADFNGDRVVDTRDFVAFLNAWAGGDDDADFDGNGVIDTRDFIAFLNAWSAGC